MITISALIRLGQKLLKFYVAEWTKVVVAVAAAGILVAVVVEKLQIIFRGSQKVLSWKGPTRYFRVLFLFYSTSKTGQL